MHTLEKYMDAAEMLKTAADYKDMLARSAGGAITGGVLGGTIGAIAKPVKMYLDKNKHNAKYNIFFDSPINYSAKDYLKGSLQGAGTGAFGGAGVGAILGLADSVADPIEKLRQKQLEKIIDRAAPLPPRKYNRFDDIVDITAANHNNYLAKKKNRLDGIIAIINQRPDLSRKDKKRIIDKIRQTPEFEDLLNSAKDHSELVAKAQRVAKHLYEGRMDMGRRGLKWFASLPQKERLEKVQKNFDPEVLNMVPANKLTYVQHNVGILKDINNLLDTDPMYQSFLRTLL